MPTDHAAARMPDALRGICKALDRLIAETEAIQGLIPQAWVEYDLAAGVAVADGGTEIARVGPVTNADGRRVVLVVTEHEVAAESTPEADDA